MSASVEQVIVVSRHGQRWPVSPLPGVPTDFPLAKITYKGKKQLFKTGQEIGQRWPLMMNEVRAFYSDVSRCKDSLESLLSGAGLDDIRACGMADVNISKWDDLEMEKARPFSFGIKAAVDNLSEKNSVILKEFLRQSAPSLVSCDDDEQCFKILPVLDAVTTFKANGVELPNWIEEHYAQLEGILNELFIALLPHGGELFFNYLAPFLRDDLQQHRKGLSIYVISDVHLMPLIARLGLPSNQRPPFAACLQMEIHGDGSVATLFEGHKKRFHSRDAILKRLK